MSKRDGRVPAYVCGGAGCGHFWVVDPERQVWGWTPRGRYPIGREPVPGSGRILAADANSATVILDSGESFAWTARGWVQMPSLTATSGILRVTCGTFGVCTTAGDLEPGGTVELPEAEAMALVRQGRVELVKEATP